MSAWSLAGGTIIDFDHFLDYWIHGERPPRPGGIPRHFFDVMCKDRLDRVFLLLHSWELLAGLLLAGMLRPGWAGWMIPFAFGMGIHLIMDSFYLRPSVLRYSLAARWARRFDGDFFYGGVRRWKEEERPARGTGRGAGIPGAGETDAPRKDRLFGGRAPFAPRNEAVEERDHLLLVRRVD